MNVSGLPTGNECEAGSTFPLSVSVGGTAANDNANYTWTVTDPYGNHASSSGNAYSFTPTDNGNYTIAVSATDKTSSQSIIYPTSETIQVLSTPPAPTSFATTSVSESGVDLQWSPDPTDLSGYQIEQSENGGNTWSQPVQVPASASGWDMPGPFDPSHNYEFQIQSVNVLGVVGQAATLNLLSSPAVTVNSDTQISVSWARYRPAAATTYSGAMTAAILGRRSTLLPAKLTPG